MPILDKLTEEKSASPDLPSWNAALNLRIKAVKLRHAGVSNY
jgi:hypothetical protein